MIAFNLVMQFRCQAAKLANVEPRRLSFKGVWTSFRDRLLLKEPETVSQWQDFCERVSTTSQFRGPKAQSFA